MEQKPVAETKTVEEFETKPLQPEVQMKATMSNKRFKQFFTFRRLQKECEDTEAQLKKIAISLAVCTDAINQAQDRNEFLRNEISTLERKTDKAKK